MFVCSTMKYIPCFEFPGNLPQLSLLSLRTRAAFDHCTIDSNLGLLVTSILRIFFNLMAQFQNLKKQKVANFFFEVRFNPFPSFQTVTTDESKWLQCSNIVYGNKTRS